eukprot:Tbor_TRINITY_DN2764_c0_g2::TRINITY_DN2764_c0_g2_i1::g.15232::m.15232/K07962/ARL13B, ARL2L1; ADP-ribosylation factor-like protein 13B
MADPRIDYCKTHNIHHLFELLATKLLHERPENPFQYLKKELCSIEESERKRKSGDQYDPTVISKSNIEGKGGLRNVTLAMLGLDCAGKTALLSAMSGCYDTDTTPTVGFSPSQFTTDTHEITIFDLGGGDNFRGIWHHYFHDCHGFFFVVDLSDECKFKDAATSFRNIVENDFMRGKPLVIVVNKIDLIQLSNDAAIQKMLDVLNVRDVVPSSMPYISVVTCAIMPNDAGNDEEIEKAITWIVESVDKNYATLADRVRIDTLKLKEEKKRTIADQRARVDAMKD